jgi:uncharacterized protein YutE (UPF0331/DUF86 family)
MGEAFATLSKEGVVSAEISVQMQKAVGFRNIAVHQYQSIDWQIVHAICQPQYLGHFENFAREVLASLEADPSRSPKTA